MSQFEYSLYSVDKDSTVIPCESFNDDDEDGKQILYLDSLSFENYKKVFKCYKFKITNQKNKADQNGEKFLINFKLEFNAEKYHENEQLTINQWKLWHESIAFIALAKDIFSNFELEFISIKKNTDKIQDMANSNTLPNNRTFLWDLGQTDSGCEFDVQFGCHSTQFPIQIDNNRYVGSLFLLTVEVYSVLSKEKLKSHTFKLKISRSKSSQFKLDSGIAQELTEFQKTEAPKPPLIEQNLQELLASLNVNNVDNQLANTEAALPSFEKLKEVKLDQSFFSYKACMSTMVENAVPIVSLYSWDRGFPIEIENLHFNNFYSHNELIKTVFTLTFAHVNTNSRYQYPETIYTWQTNWVRSNPGKSLLQFLDCEVDDTVLFDVYSMDYNQFCLIWLPSAAGKLSIKINIAGHEGLKKQSKYETTLSVESFLISNNEKVDAASCKLNFFRDNRYSICERFCPLKSEPSYLVGKVLYISVDGGDYKFILFQNAFVDKISVNDSTFKSKLAEFIKKSKNMDTLFKIRKLNYFKSTKATENSWFYFRDLKPKTVFKCNLHEVTTNEGENEQQQNQIDPDLVQYDVDLIDQEENYSKAYI